MHKANNLNFLEPYGPLQATNRTALSLPLSAIYDNDDILGK